LVPTRYAEILTIMACVITLPVPLIALMLSPRHGKAAFCRDMA
jgi:hypothetical protein